MTETYQQYSQQMSEEQDENGSPDGSAVLGSLLWESFISWDFATRDQLTVYLESPHEPLLTNGDWLSDETRLRWQMRLSPRDSSTADVPPNLCYAIWSEPDHDFQQRHFGQITLEGKPLATYCSWRVSLDDREGAEWDRFLENITAADDVATAVSEFAFSGEPETWSPAAQQIKQIQELFETIVQ